MSNLILFPHNQETLNKIKKSYEKDKIVAFIQATGTGKTYILLQYILDNPNTKFLLITPYISIIEYINEIIKEYNLNINNLQIINYQTLIKKDQKELSEYQFDHLIIDEFQHLGAPVWGAKVDELISTHPNARILGTTAYTIRDRGTIYERDMALPDGDELFSDKVITRYDLIDAILDGVLPTPRYLSTHYNIIEYINKVISRIENKPEYEEYLHKLQAAKERINDSNDAQKLIVNNIKKTGKYIYFCPSLSESGVNDIDTIMSETRKYLLNNGYTNEDIIFYKSTSEYELGKENRTAFHNDTDLQGNKVDNKLRIMFCINQYNEGIHSPNIDGVILGRSTKSDMVFFEQIGRALSIKDNTKLIQELSKLTKEELISYCKKNNIPYKNTYTKEELIKQIITPTIIDLSDNYEYMMELVTELHLKKKEYRPHTDYLPRVIKIEDIEFDITYLHQNIYELLKTIESTLITYTFDDYYKLATTYYNYYNNLLVPRHYKTLDGINPHQYGYDLGEFISRSRVEYKKGLLSQDKIDLLNNIGMIWQLTNSWQDSYLLAKEYYEEHHNLDIPSSYKTKDGYALGNWLALQRSKYKKGLLSPDKIDLLNDLHINWTILYTFEEAYKLLEIYYNHYGNINVPYNFKTTNGIEYDIAGYNLYTFIKNQKEKYSRNELTITEITKLEKLHINWTIKKQTLKSLTFDESYALLSKYYYHYHNLDIKRTFKTFDGINYDENGYSLGNMVSRLRIKYKNNELTKTQIDLLNSIGMIWQVQTNKQRTWKESYLEALKFYEENGHLLIPATYKLEDGFALGNWIYLQRKNKEELSPEQIRLLNEIHMIWDPKKDTNKIIELCNKYNINYKINKDILTHITYQEFYSKIRFLLSMDSLLVINDILHPIFTMSDEALETNYHTTREEIIRNYLPRTKKRGLI